MARGLVKRVLLASPRGYCAGVERAVETVEQALDLYGAPVYVRKQIVHNAPADGARLAYVPQPTLSVDETREIVEALKRRFPAIRGPQREDICYATTNRQRAVKELLPEVDLLLVIGSRNSSNSNRLVEVAHAAGVESHLIDDETEIDEAWLAGVETVGVTSGASAPERLVTRVCDWFRGRGVTDIEQFRSVVEDVMFRLPVELRRAQSPAA